MISGNAGILLSKVLYVKEGEDRKFLIVDAAMNDLIRPALYDAYHEIEPVKAPGNAYDEVTYDVVGPICESGDTFTKSRDLPEMKAGELLVMHSAGAYGAAQASQYNTRPLVPEVLVKAKLRHIYAFKAHERLCSPRLRLSLLGALCACFCDGRCHSCYIPNRVLFRHLGTYWRSLASHRFACRDYLSHQSGLESPRRKTP